MGKRFLLSLPLYLAFFLLLGQKAPCQAASFTAVMTETQDNESSTGKIAVQDQGYRMEFTDEDDPLVVLVDMKGGKTRIMKTKEQLYRELDNSDMHVLMNDPFASYRYMVNKYGIHGTAPDMYQGLACTRQDIAINGRDVITAWIADKYQFPVKIVNRMNGHRIELDRITEKSLPDSLFTVPAGYRLVNRFPFAVPEWAEDIARSPMQNAPFEATLDQGRVMRFKPRNGYTLIIECSGTGQAQTTPTVTIVAFDKNGRPLSDPDLNTVTLRGSRSMRKIYRPENNGMDFVAVHVTRGQLHLKATEKEQIKRQEFSLQTNNGRGKSLDAGKASRLILTDDPADGKESVANLVLSTVTPKDLGNGMTGFETREVQREQVKLANGQSRTWDFAAARKIGNIDVRVLQGAVHVSIEQPEKAGQIPPSWQK